jgi:hypothetical protein
MRISNHRWLWCGVSLACIAGSAHADEGDYDQWKGQHGQAFDRIAIPGLHR